MMTSRRYTVHDGCHRTLCRRPPGVVRYVKAEALDQAASAVPESSPRGAGSPTFRRKLEALKDILEDLRDLSRVIEQQRQEAGKTVRIDGRVGDEALVKILDGVANRYRSVVSDLKDQGKSGQSLLAAVEKVGRTLVEGNLGLERREGSPLLQAVTDHQIFDARARESTQERHRPQPGKSGPPGEGPRRFDDFG